MIDPNLLSFCIPTYNNAEYLKQILPSLINQVKNYGFKIIVSDNASTDNTLQVVEESFKNYTKITYFKQNENIGMDRNFEFVLKASESKYAILLGDTYEVIAEEFVNIIKILESEKYCVVFLNSYDRVKDIVSKEYTSSIDILNEIGWHITLMSSSIFCKKLIQGTNFFRYYNTNFIQVGIIYDFLEDNKNDICYWYANNCLTNIPKLSTWYSNVLNVFGKNWTNCILSLPPSLPLPVKLKCIKEHGIKSGLFNFRSLLNYREKGYIGKEDYIKYREYFSFFFNKKTYLYFRFLIFVPNIFFKVIKKYLYTKQ